MGQPQEHDTRGIITLYKYLTPRTDSCTILDTIKLTVGTVWTDADTPGGTNAYLNFRGAVVTGEISVSGSGMFTTRRQLTGKSGSESHSLQALLGEGCEETDCELSINMFAHGALSAHVDGDVTRATGDVTIAFTDEPPIELAVEVDPKEFPKEDEDKKEITIHGSASGSVAGSAPLEPGSPKGTASGGVDVQLKYVWRKKGPNSEADTTALDITRPEQPCDKVITATTTVTGEAFSGSISKAAEVEPSFERVGIIVKGEIHCANCKDRHAAWPERNPEAGTKQEQFKQLGDWLLSLRSYRADLPGRQPVSLPGEMAAASADHARRLAETVITVEQFHDVLRLGETIEARGGRRQEDPTAAVARALDAHIELLGWVEELVQQDAIVESNHLSSMLDAAAAALPAERRPSTSTATKGTKRTAPSES